MENENLNKGLFGSLFNGLFDDDESPLLEVEILDEGTIVKDKKNNWTLEVRPSDSRWRYTPYFKLSHGLTGWNNQHNPKKRIRISLQYVCYIYRKSDPGDWELRTDERDALMEILKSPAPADFGVKGNVWQAMLQNAKYESPWPLPNDFLKWPLLNYRELDTSTKYDDHLIILEK